MCQKPRSEVFAHYTAHSILIHRDDSLFTRAPAHQVENYLDLRAGKMGHARKQVEKANKQRYGVTPVAHPHHSWSTRLRHEAARRGIPLSQVLSNVLVQRSVKAHTRDLRLIPSSVLTRSWSTSRET